MTKKLDHCPECGCVLSKYAQPRSPKQHRAFFHMIRMAFDNWPEKHEFNPDNPDHLRAWLLAKSGHRVIRNERLKAGTDMTAAQMLTFARALMLTSRDRYCFVVEHMGTIAIVEPKSISWETTTHEEFKPLFEEVLHLIEAEAGIKVEFIKQELRQFE
jgi:hypothetical protein